MKLADDYFVISMRIDETNYNDFSIDFIRLNGIDCGANWASGLDALIKVLERDGVVHSANAASPILRAWRDFHQHHTRAITSEREMLQSNWLPMQKLPEHLNFFKFLGTPKTNELRAIASACTLLCTDHHRLLASFATEAELQAALGDGIPIKSRGVLKTSEFLRGYTGDIVGIAPKDAKNKVTSMIRQAWDNTMRDRGLLPYEMANGKFFWWFPDGIPEDGFLRYTDINGKSSRRAVSGVRGKKEGPDGLLIPRYYWHLGFTAKPFLTDRTFVALHPRIIISEDRKTPLKNKARLNSVRRSLTNMWFNDKWRGLIMGFSSWLAKGNETFSLPVARDLEIRLGGQPMIFESPVGVAADLVSFEWSDDIAELSDHAEIQMRLSDPDFLNVYGEVTE